MSEKEYIYYLTLGRKDRFRYYHDLIQGKIVRFVVQYEAYINGSWYPIIRYDTAHGHPHKDILHPNKPQEKIEFHGYSTDDVLTLGERDIKANWQHYRVKYEQEME